MRFNLMILLTFLFAAEQAVPQNNAHFNPGRRYDKGIRVMFYNVENLYDVHNDSLTDDDEFTPQGIRGWGKEKVQKKLNNLSKVIISIGGWEPPEIIGLCEIENKSVLYKLLRDTPLNDFSYRFVHYDSPDPRGMDVALVYRPEKFKVIKSVPIPVKYPGDSNSRTRDILYVEGRALNRDTLHIFINHWPSRYGGYTETIDKRNFAAGTLRSKVDSLLAKDISSKILVMGDFNDEPTDFSVREILKAKMDSTDLQARLLYNLMGDISHKSYRGTIKNRQMWYIFDQFMVSASLLKCNAGLGTTFHSAHIFNDPAIMQKDDAWLGEKPYRTFYGASYLGGFSDHLPVFTDLLLFNPSK